MGTTTTPPYHYFAASTVESTCASEGGTPTSKDMCFHACKSGVGGANRYKVGRWHHSPGCFVVVSGRWQGGCHWNLDTSANAYHSPTRAICTTVTTATTTTTMQTTSAPTPKVPGLERRLRGAVQTWAKVLGEEDQGILI